jgi:hypothetical protein
MDQLDDARQNIRIGVRQHAVTQVEDVAFGMPARSQYVANPM